MPRQSKFKYSFRLFLSISAVLLSTLVSSPSQGALVSWMDFDGLDCKQPEGSPYPTTMKFTCNQWTHICSVNTSSDIPDNLFFLWVQMTPTGASTYSLVWNTDEDPYQGGEGYCDDKSCYSKLYIIGGGREDWYWISYTLNGPLTLRVGYGGTPDSPDRTVDFQCVR